MRAIEGGLVEEYVAIEWMFDPDHPETYYLPGEF